MPTSRLLAILAISTALPLAAQTRFEFWPGASYDPQIPTFKKVLGYDPGERITNHAGIVKYLDALAASSHRIKVFDYGSSWEGRKLVYAAVGSEANIRRLEAIRAGMQRLADPRRTPEAEARKIMASIPATIWLAYGVHGNEISSPDAALLTAYHLLASRNDKMADEILAKALVILVPTQNPDGRDRFIHNFEENEGLEPDANPTAAEHIEPWPGARSNHYLFDMNRDWIPLTQPEIRSQVKALLEWYPLVYVDLHEMGSDSTYYFTPEADPYNPHLTKEQRASLDWFGKNNAKWFDRFGFDYFTRDVFDAFYPGYGASWPEYYGCIAMTYEQASARGLVMRRTSTDAVFHFRDTVRQHFVASISTAETAAQTHDKLLEQFYRYRQTAIEEGSKEPVREYILARRGDTGAVDKLAAVLSEQGIEVRKATASFKAAGKEFPAGSYAVSLAQPAKRLIRTLLDPDVPMEKKFLAEQERRRRKKLPDEIYDVTAWSLPLAYNVETVASPEPLNGSFEQVRPQRIPPGRIAGEKAEVAYLAPGDTIATGRLLAAALRQGLRVLSVDKPFSQNGHKFPGGTLIFKVKSNPADLHARLAKLAETTGANLYPTDSGWVEDGPNFGSRYVVELRKPSIAMAWDRPTSSSAAGATRFVIEREFGYPVTPIRTQSLSFADLSKFNVLILPDSSGDYSSALGAPGLRKVREWVASGGTLLALGDAVSFLADPRVGLLAISQENAAKPADAAKPEAGESRRPTGAAPSAAATPPGPAAPEAPKPEPRVPGKLFATEEDYQKAIRADSELPDGAQGVMLKAKLDPDHWITAGVPETVYPLFSGSAIFTPIKLDKGTNAGLFSGPSDVLASGYLWEETKKQVAYKPFLVVGREGRGNVIAFTVDPTFRASLDGLHMLLVNAVFRAPSHIRGGARD